jgi:serine/threonine-protein kinase
MLHCPTCGQDFADEIKVCPDDGTPLQADSTVAMSAPVDPLIGRTFDDKYRLDERLGTGGMGTVYRATHLLIDRPVAVKVLNPRYVEDEAAQTRFRREARAAGRLQHVNAVTVTDFGSTQDGYVYIVMELLEGRTLREVLARDAPLDVARAVSIMLQISAAVGAAHDAGVIHRDLKPANIFIVQRKEAPPFVKVLDFGIAKLAADAIDDDDPHTLTQVGAMIGTPRYMSPEQCDGRDLTPASDVYSLGIILYEMLTGTTPFNGTSALAIALKHSSMPPRCPREFVASIPVALEEIVLHALEKRPENRPANAHEFRKGLYAVAEFLGLEHAESISAPTIETLRSAGTETPSGRLVIDIERLRESRAAAAIASRTMTTVVPQQSVSAHSDGAYAPSAATPYPVPPPPPPPPLALSRPPGVSRMRIFFGRGSQIKQDSSRRTIIILSLVLVSLVVLGGVLAFITSPWSKRILIAGGETEALSKIFVPGGALGERPGEVGPSEVAERNKARRASAPARKPKKESRIKRILRKINPFD